MNPQKPMSGWVERCLPGVDAFRCFRSVSGEAPTDVDGTTPQLLWSSTVMGRANPTITEVRATHCINPYVYLIVNCMQLLQCTDMYMLYVVVNYMGVNLTSFNEI